MQGSGEWVRRRAPAWLAFGALLMQCAACAAAVQGTERLEEALRGRLERERQQLDLPGATAAFVLPDGRSGSVAAGFADLERKRPMRPETRMPAGSIGKTFVSALALSLVEEGRLSLDDRLSKWLGDEPWYGRLPNGADIRIRDLLNHSAGIQEHVESEGFLDLVRQQVSRDPDAAIEPRALVALVLDRPPLFPAGHGYKYADTGYILLQLAIEKAGGISLWNEAVRRFIYPLQLDATSPAVGRLHAGLAQGYLNEELLPGQPRTTLDGGVFRWNPVSEWAGGGFISNSLDLARWASALYAGRASPSDLGARMTTEQNLNRAPEGYAYGLGVVVRQSSHGLVWGHAGVYPGYRSNMSYFVDCQVALATQVNTDRLTGPQMAALSSALADTILNRLRCRRSGR
jgi:D-alanyl-D-alanine carboxypeptidase